MYNWDSAVHAGADGKLFAAKLRIAGEKAERTL